MTAKTPVQIWIGVASTDLSHDDYFRFVCDWSSGLQDGLTHSWMIMDIPWGVPRGFGPRQSVISIGAPATTGADESPATARRWLTQVFAELNSSPAGWRIWPSATASTIKWAEALVSTRYGAKRFHNAVMRAVWATTRTHWNSTCMQTPRLFKNPGHGPTE
ncbi:unnamed protein product [Phytophthora fragariaefolia]|uniref:Unnamed protein product n=1 Tax=Phytophthora fragariaefolia TaxID=1490495 RepID=A0A9W6XAR4_9STRA|nr:unnamed protein product [Phytophthora fragariaefolia]